MGHTISSAPMHLSDLLHIDKNLPTYIHQYGVWFYGIMFLILFAETGLVVTPFLPGDTLLFGGGDLLQRRPGARVCPWCWWCLLRGSDRRRHSELPHRQFFGPGESLVRRPTSFLNRKHLAETHEFFEKYGSQGRDDRARWIPVVRNVHVPSVGGVSGMPRSGRFHRLERPRGGDLGVWSIVRSPDSSLGGSRGSLRILSWRWSRWCSLPFCRSSTKSKRPAGPARFESPPASPPPRSNLLGVRGLDRAFTKRLDAPTAALFFRLEGRRTKKFAAASRRQAG